MKVRGRGVAVLLIVALGCVVAACSGPSPDPADVVVEPDWTAVRGGTQGGPVDCQDTAVFGRVAELEPVDRAWCAKFEYPAGVLATGGLLLRLEVQLVTQNPGAFDMGGGCLVGLLDDYPLAYQECATSVVLPEYDGYLGQVRVYTEIQPDDLRTLHDTLERKGELAQSDYEGIQVTAWVIAFWGYPTLEA